MAERLRWLVPGLVLWLAIEPARWPVPDPAPWITRAAWGAAALLAVLPWLAPGPSRRAIAVLLGAAPWLVGLGAFAVRIGVAWPDAEWAAVPAIEDGARLTALGLVTSSALFAGLAIAALPDLWRRGRPRLAVCLAAVVAAGALAGLGSLGWGAELGRLVAGPCAALLAIAAVAALGAPRGALTRAALFACASVVAAGLAVEARCYADFAGVIAGDGLQHGCLAPPEHQARYLLAEETPLVALAPWAGLAPLVLAAIGWLARGSARSRVRAAAPTVLGLFALVLAHDGAMLAMSRLAVRAHPVAEVALELPVIPAPRSWVRAVDLEVRRDGSFERRGRHPSVVAVEAGTRWADLDRALGDEPGWSMVVTPSGPPEAWRAELPRALPWLAEVHARDRYGAVWMPRCGWDVASRWRARIDDRAGNLQYLTYDISWEDPGALEIDPEATIDTVLTHLWIERVAGRDVCVRPADVSATRGRARP